MAEQDAQMTEAIAFFEQMLQTMPDARTSLEFLAVAYEQTGQRDKQIACLIRLADCLLAEKDLDNAQAIAIRLAVFRDVPEVAAAVDRVANQIQRQSIEHDKRDTFAGRPGPGGRLPLQDVGIEIHALSRAAISAEIDLVWLWRDRGFLSKDFCMDVLHVLSDRPVTDQPVLISAFALLDEQRPELTDGLLDAMQLASNLPPIPLELFEIQQDARQALPGHFVHVRGVLPFALMGGEALVALLNPLNEALMRETEARAGRTCHFFLAHPRAWQQVAQTFI